MALIQPDADLVVAETGRKCRLGLVTRDVENRYWGLTARHAFAGLETTRVKDAEGRIIGRFSEADNDFGFGRDDAASQIVRLQIERPAPDNVAYVVTWPRYAAEEGALLGSSVISIDASHRLIGTIVEVDSLASITFPEAHEPTIIQGAIIVALADPGIVKPGQAGTLLLSESGEAVALGIATQRAGGHLELIASPLRTYLQRTGLRPWAPSGAHWTDLNHRARRFLMEATADEGPDLGRAPSVERG